MGISTVLLYNLWYGAEWCSSVCVCTVYRSSTLRSVLIHNITIHVWLTSLQVGRGTQWRDSTTHKWFSLASNWKNVSQIPKENSNIFTTCYLCWNQAHQVPESNYWRLDRLRTRQPSCDGCMNSFVLYEVKGCLTSDQWWMKVNCKCFRAKRCLNPLMEVHSALFSLIISLNKRRILKSDIGPFFLSLYIVPHKLVPNDHIIFKPEISSVAIFVFVP